MRSTTEFYNLPVQRRFIYGGGWAFSHLQCIKLDRGTLDENSTEADADVLGNCEDKLLFFQTLYDHQFLKITQMRIPVDFWRMHVLFVYMDILLQIVCINDSSTNDKIKVIKYTGSKHSTQKNYESIQMKCLFSSYDTSDLQKTGVGIRVISTCEN